MFAALLASQSQTQLLKNNEHQHLKRLLLVGQSKTLIDEMENTRFEMLWLQFDFIYAGCDSAA